MDGCGTCSNSSFSGGNIIFDLPNVRTLSRSISSSVLPLVLLCREPDSVSVHAVNKSCMETWLLYDSCEILLARPGARTVLSYPLEQNKNKSSPCLMLMSGTVTNQTHETEQGETHSTPVCHNKLEIR
jgi:hypothetical protein